MESANCIGKLKLHRRCDIDAVGKYLFHRYNNKTIHKYTGLCGGTDIVLGIK